VEIRIEKQARGIRMLTGREAKTRRDIINRLILFAEKSGFQEIVLPCVEPSDIYKEKAGSEILGQMYVFLDRKGRSLCLRPEGTATCQLLAQGPLQQEKDIKLWYETRCWRYERPQAGRYREFTQFGIEVLNPTRDFREELIILAKQMISEFTTNYEIAESIKRGLSYYTESGFEITCPKLGAQKQVLGGGRYAEGIGFAIGVDRLMLTQIDIGL